MVRQPVFSMSYHQCREEHLVKIAPILRKCPSVHLGPSGLFDRRCAQWLKGYLFAYVFNCVKRMKVWFQLDSVSYCLLIVLLWVINLMLCFLIFYILILIISAKKVMLSPPSVHLSVCWQEYMKSFQEIFVKPRRIMDCCFGKNLIKFRSFICFGWWINGSYLWFLMHDILVHGMSMYVGLMHLDVKQF